MFSSLLIERNDSLHCAKSTEQHHTEHPKKFSPGSDEDDAPYSRDSKITTYEVHVCGMDVIGRTWGSCEQLVIARIHVGLFFRSDEPTQNEEALSTRSDSGPIATRSSRR